MRRALSGLGWQAYALGLLAFAPHRLFDRLSALDWYGGALGAWAEGAVPDKPSRILEVAAGSGALSRRLSHGGHEVVALDRALPALREGARRGGRCAYVAGNALAMPFPDGHFDAVLAASLINVVDAPGKLTDEMARVAAPGGRVAVLFPTPGMDKAAADRFVDRHGLEGFSAHAIRLWAARARKMEPEVVSGWLRGAGLVRLSASLFLDGMVCALSARKGR